MDQVHTLLDAVVDHRFDGNETAERDLGEIDIGFPEAPVVHVRLVVQDLLCIHRIRGGSARG